MVFTPTTQPKVTKNTTFETIAVLITQNETLLPLDTMASRSKHNIQWKLLFSNQSEFGKGLATEQKKHYHITRRRGSATTGPGEGPGLTTSLNGFGIMK